MEVQLSFRDMAWYYGIPYDLYDQNPEKWGNFIEKAESTFLRHRKATLTERWHFDKKNDISPQKIDLLLHLALRKLETQLQKTICEHILGKAYTFLPIPPDDNDYNSDKRVIISYQAGSGGNFLTNCLYFNDSSGCMSLFSMRRMFPLSEITSKSTDMLPSTLDNIEEKLNYVISETKDQSIWMDPILVLNCKLQDHKILITKLHEKSIKKTLLDGLQIYPNCKTIIYYKNTRLFRYLREYKDYNVWDAINSEPRSNSKQTILQFIKKSQETKKKLIDFYNDKTQVYSYCCIHSKITFYVWDTNWYFSERDTIDHIKELYELLSLPGFNDNAISKYYNVWIETTSDLKTKALNEIT